MLDVLTPNTQAIFLLTAPLLVGRRVSIERPLSPLEYGQLALQLHHRQREPADLLGAQADLVLAECAEVVDEERVRRLLARGLLLAQALERWAGRALWAISRADPAYPRRLKQRLSAAAPPVLYGCGDVRLLADGDLALIGPRKVDPAAQAYGASLGRLIADAQRTLVSGGARGLEQAAQASALAHGGRALAVLTDSLERVALEREHRDALRAQTLLLVSPFDPGAGFDAVHGRPRDALTCALSEALLVANAASSERAGPDPSGEETWTRASESLTAESHLRVFVRARLTSHAEGPAETSKPEVWPSPIDAVGLRALLPRPNTTHESDKI